MVNYQNAKVYLIEPIDEHDEGDAYVGSTTTNYLSTRLASHKNKYKQYKKDKSNFVTVFSLFDKYSVDNCNISLLELVSCSSKNELLTREGHYIRTLKCINKYISGRNQKEYYQDNKKQILKYQKEYNDMNKEQIQEYQKQYYNLNKEQINEYQNEKNNCICGGNYTNNNKQKHFRSLKHKFFIDIELWKYRHADVMHQIFDNKLFFNCYCKSESIL